MASIRLANYHKENILINMPFGRLWQSTNMPVREQTQVRQLYLDAFPKDIVKSAVHLMDSTYARDLLRTRNDFSFKLPAYDDVAFVTFNTGFGNLRWPNLGRRIELTNDNPQCDALLQWGPRGVQAGYREQIAQIVIRDLVTNVCNTSGQLLTAWPDSVNFLAPEVATELSEAKRASFMPAGFTSQMRFWLPHITTWMAMASMLPDTTRWSGELGGYGINVSNIPGVMNDAQMGIDPYHIIS